jgi:undecaprenyl-diphosphatase
MSTVATPSGLHVGARHHDDAHPLRTWPLRRDLVWQLVGTGVVAAATLSIVGKLFMWFLDDGPVGDADRRASRWFADHRTDTWNRLSEMGSMITEWYVKIGLLIVVGVIMSLVLKRWHEGVFLACCVIWETLVFVTASIVVDRGRPPVDHIDAPAKSGSFPSGHSAAAVAFWGALFVIACWHTRRRAVRIPLLVLAVVMPLIVGLSRVERGMHHPIDVLVGWTLGIVAVLVAQRCFLGSDTHVEAGTHGEART